MVETIDFLWKNISQLPYFRGLLRAVESKFYQGIPLIDPVLDLGSGDGHFASVAFRQAIACGVDPWMNPIIESKAVDVYRNLIRAEGASLPLPDNCYGTVISNSVLEHIPVLEPVLEEVNRVLRRNGKFIFCVPNHRFLESLSMAEIFKKMKFRGLAKTYQHFFNWISRHYHCDDPARWTERLRNAGFKIERYFHYFSLSAFHVLEWGHYFGLPSLVWKKLFNRWILVPEKWNLLFTETITRKHYLEGERPNDGVYTFYISSKIQ